PRSTLFPYTTLFRSYMIERVADLVAAELGKDPVDVRRKNFPKPGEFPFTSATGVIYDSANYQRSLDKALDLAGYDKLRKTQAARSEEHTSELQSLAY